MKSRGGVKVSHRSLKVNLGFGRGVTYFEKLFPFLSSGELTAFLNHCALTSRHKAIASFVEASLI